LGVVVVVVVVVDKALKKTLLRFGDEFE